MRLIHTADWHLGQSFHGVSREYEHQCFLDWLLDRIGEQAVDALIVAGDVFDGQNPPIGALAQFYRFLAAARSRFPHLQTVIVAGNHDSGSRLEAPSPLLDALGVRVVGALAADPAAHVVPLVDRAGRPAARCVAVPYLRPADLPPQPEEDSGDPLIEGVRQVYATLVAAARAQLRPGEALILTGHCYMAGGALSDLSERKILGGNLHALPGDIFPEDAAYVALGHLHRAQRVGGREGVRYSGSPIPLALDEDTYSHQVRLIDLSGGTLVGCEALRVPRSVPILRLPGGGRAAPADAVLAALARLPLDPAAPREVWPYLELTVELSEPRPSLRAEVETAVAGLPVRLLRLAVRPAGRGEALADAEDVAPLADLAPDEVFRRLHESRHGEAPAADLTAAFHELLETVA